MAHAGDNDLLGLSVEHANFVQGSSKRNPAKHHFAPYFVNKQNKSCIDWSEFVDALENVAQSNTEFVIDGRMIIRLHITKPTSSGSGDRPTEDDIHDAQQRDSRRNNPLLSAVRSLERYDVDHYMALAENTDDDEYDDDLQEAMVGDDDDDSEDDESNRRRNAFVLEECGSSGEALVVKERQRQQALVDDIQTIISEEYTEDDDKYLHDLHLREELHRHFNNIKNYYRIKNNCNSCGWLAFALGKFIVDLEKTKNESKRKWRMKQMTNPAGGYATLRKYLLTEIVPLVPDVDINIPMTESDLMKLQSVFRDYKLIVFHRPLRREKIQLKVLFADPSVPIETPEKIILEFVKHQDYEKDELTMHGGHYNTIHPAYVASYCPKRLSKTWYRKFCFYCNTPPTNIEHNCNKKKCDVCHDPNPCIVVQERECERCGLRPVSDVCQLNHEMNQRCRQYRKCEECQKSIHRCNYKKHVENDCKSICIKCGEKDKSSPHYCYLNSKPIEVLKRQDDEPGIMVTYDIECTIDDVGDNAHKPYLLCAFITCDNCYNSETHERKSMDCGICGQQAHQSGLKVFRGTQCVEDFLEFLCELFPDRCDGTRMDVYAHNAGSYDAQYLLRAVYNDVTLNTDKVSLVMTGNKILKVDLGTKKMYFYDSVMIFQQSLASLSISFALRLMKGYSPLGLLLMSNLLKREFTERNVFPSINYFFTTFLNDKQYSELTKWHKEASLKFSKSNKIYDFEKELQDYCVDDCRVLMAAIQTFRNKFKSVTELDPLRRNFTLASIALEHFLTKKKPEHKIGITPVKSYRPEPYKEKAGNYSKQKSKVEVSVMNLIIRENNGQKFCNLAFDVDNKDEPCKWQTEARLGTYYPDGFCSTHKTVVEFNGCFWHPHDNCKSKGKNTNELINNVRIKADAKKLKFYKDEKYNCYVLHECSYLRDRCLKAIFPTVFYDTLKEHLEHLQIRIEEARTSGYIDIRDAMFGGRTMNLRHLVDCRQSEERIWHSDIVSMYPYVLHKQEFPLEHPTLIEAPEKYDHSWFGFVKCEVICPMHLGIGVLPYRHNQRLVFPLCKRCLDEDDNEPIFKKCNHYHTDRIIDGTWTTVELKKAFEYGYTPGKIAFVLHYEKKETGVFSEYILVRKFQNLCRL